jgi:hypothetical protein
MTDEPKPLPEPFAVTEAARLVPGDWYCAWRDADGTMWAQEIPAPPPGSFASPLNEDLTEGAPDDRPISPPIMPPAVRLGRTPSEPGAPHR